MLYLQIKLYSLETSNLNDGADVFPGFIVIPIFSGVFFFFNLSMNENLYEDRRDCSHYTLPVQNGAKLSSVILRLFTGIMQSSAG